MNITEEEGRVMMMVMRGLRTEDGISVWMVLDVKKYLACFVPKTHKSGTE